jgi:hypothetical protein
LDRNDSPDEQLARVAGQSASEADTAGANLTVVSGLDR